MDELNKRLGLVGDDQYRVHYLKYKELLPLIFPEYQHLLAPYPTDKTVGGRRRFFQIKTKVVNTKLTWMLILQKKKYI